LLKITSKKRAAPSIADHTNVVLEGIALIRKRRGCLQPFPFECGTHQLTTIRYWSFVIRQPQCMYQWPWPVTN